MAAAPRLALFLLSLPAPKLQHAVEHLLFGEPQHLLLYCMPCLRMRAVENESRCLQTGVNV